VNAALLLLGVTLGLALAVPLVLGIWSNPFKLLVPTSDSPTFERMQDRARPVVSGFGSAAGRIGRKLLGVFRVAIAAIGALVRVVAIRLWMRGLRAFKWLRIFSVRAARWVRTRSAAGARLVVTRGRAASVRGRAASARSRAAAATRARGLRSPARAGLELAGAISSKFLLLIKAVGLSVWTFILSVAIAAVTVVEFVVTKTGEATLMSAVRVAGFRRSKARVAPWTPPAVAAREEMITAGSPEVVTQPARSEGVIDRIKPVLDGFSLARESVSDVDPSRRLASSRLILAVVVSATGFAVLVILVVRWAEATIRGIVS
jgi:hypothetical protein